MEQCSQPLTNSTCTKRTSTASDVTAVPLLQAMLDQLRAELASVRMALDSERSAVKSLKRDRAKEVKAVREEEAVKRRNALSDLRSRLERDHEDSLQRQKEVISKTFNAEMLRTLKMKDSEMRHELNEAHSREEALKIQVRDAVQANRFLDSHQQQGGATNGEIQKLRQEISSLRAHSKELEERLQVVTDADRQKAADLRTQHEEHELKLSHIKKSSQQEMHKLLTELKSKERHISNLEKLLSTQTGRVEEQRERLLEFQREPHPRECNCSEVNCTRSHEKRLNQRIADLQLAMKKAAEIHAQEMKDMIGKLHELEGNSPVKVGTSAVTSKGEMERKRKLNHLSNRHRKEQMKQYNTNFMELEPVAEMEEDSGAGEDSLSSSGSPSLSPQPYGGDIWVDLSDKEYHDTLYSCLLKEHFDLQREHQFLQIRLKRELAEPNRIQICLEYELAAARSQIRDFRRMLLEQQGRSFMMAERIVTLQSEIHDLHEQNELLEFRILELEECHQNSLVRTHEPETRDVWTDTDNDTNSSGVQSLPTNEVVHSDNLEIGLHDTKQGRESKILPESTIGNTNDISKINSRIIATVLPFTDITTDTKRDQNDNFEGDTLKKQLKNAERLQESGIFEETEFYTQGTQTDSEENVDSKPLFENGIVGDLRVEIQKLNLFRERIEEKGTSTCCRHKTLMHVDGGRGDGPSPNCVAHVKELQYCRERLQILEDKVLVYESSGEIQTRLLSERLQREVRLIAQVNDLSTKVEQLSAQNKLLEEERCEFEEAENDARLKCQKLEVKLIDINEQKNDLQTQLQIERRNMSRLKTNLSESERKRQEARGQLSYVETILNKYENRNYELEEREVELRHRLEMLETTMPALMLFNMWRLVQDPKVSRAAVNTAVSNTLVKARSGIYRPMTAPELNTGRTSVRLSKQINFPSSAGDEQSKLKYLEEDRNRILTERQEAEEKWRLTEKKLNERLKELESQAVPVCSELEIYKEAEEGYKERIRKLENELYGKRGETSMFRTTSEEMASSDSDVNSVTSLGCESIECMKKIQELIQSEANMKNRITELELKERAYMETLQQADGLWSEMEHSYKTRIARAEDSEALLKDKVKKLEETESKNRQTYSNEDENYVLIEKIQSMEQNEKEFMEKIRALEMEKNKLVQETSQLREALVAAQTELQRTKELVEGPLKEELLKERKLSRTLQEEVKTAETELQEVTSAHDAEVSSLKTLLTKTSRELVDLECTNSELKEEVETLETKVVELKSSLERQKAREEEILIQTSQTILEKEKELEETKREMQFAKTPSAHEELKEVLPDTKLLSDKTGDVCLKECECPAAQGSLTDKDAPVVPIAADANIPIAKSAVVTVPEKYIEINIPAKDVNRNEQVESVPDATDSKSEKETVIAKVSLKKLDPSSTGQVKQEPVSDCLYKKKRISCLKSSVEQLGVTAPHKSQSSPDPVTAGITCLTIKTCLKDGITPRKIDSKVKEIVINKLPVPEGTIAMEEDRKENIIMKVSELNKISPHASSEAIEMPVVPSTIPKAETEPSKVSELLPYPDTTLKESVVAKIPPISQLCPRTCICPPEQKYSDESFKYSESEYSRLTVEDFPFGETGECIMEPPKKQISFTDSELERAFDEPELEDIIVSSKECLFQDQFAQLTLQPLHVDTGLQPGTIIPGQVSQLESTEVEPEQKYSDESFKYSESEYSRLTTEDFPFGETGECIMEPPKKQISFTDSELERAFDEPELEDIIVSSKECLFQDQFAQLTLQPLRVDTGLQPGTIIPGQVSQLESTEVEPQIISELPIVEGKVLDKTQVQEVIDIWPTFISDSCSVELEEDILASPMTVGTTRPFFKVLDSVSEEKGEVPSETPIEGRVEETKRGKLPSVTIDLQIQVKSISVTKDLQQGEIPPVDAVANLSSEEQTGDATAETSAQEPKEAKEIPIEGTVDALAITEAEKSGLPIETDTSTFGKLSEHPIDEKLKCTCPYYHSKKEAPTEPPVGEESIVPLSQEQSPTGEVDTSPAAETVPPETPIEKVPTELPTEEVPTEEAPTEEAPTEEVPTEEAPTEDSPIEEVSNEEAPTEEVPTAEAPTEEVPTEEVPIEEAPTEEAPTEEAPTEEAPTEEIPIEEVQMEESPIDEVLTGKSREKLPTEELPIGEVPPVPSAKKQYTEEQEMDDKECPSEPTYKCKCPYMTGEEQMKEVPVLEGAINELQPEVLVEKPSAEPPAEEITTEPTPLEVPTEEEMPSEIPLQELPIESPAEEISPETLGAVETEEEMPSEIPLQELPIESPVEEIPPQTLGAVESSSQEKLNEPISSAPPVEESSTEPITQEIPTDVQTEEFPIETPTIDVPIEISPAEIEGSECPFAIEGECICEEHKCEETDEALEQIVKAQSVPAEEVTGDTQFKEKETESLTSADSSACQVFCWAGPGKKKTRITHVAPYDRPEGKPVSTVAPVEGTFPSTEKIEGDLVTIETEGAFLEQQPFEKEGVISSEVVSPVVSEVIKSALPSVEKIQPVLPLEVDIADALQEPSTDAPIEVLTSDMPELRSEAPEEEMPTEIEMEEKPIDVLEVEVPIEAPIDDLSAQPPDVLVEGLTEEIPEISSQVQAPVEEMPPQAEIEEIPTDTTEEDMPIEQQLDALLAEPPEVEIEEPSTEISPEVEMEEPPIEVLTSDMPELPSEAQEKEMPTEIEMEEKPIDVLEVEVPIEAPTDDLSAQPPDVLVEEATQEVPTEDEVVELPSELAVEVPELPAEEATQEVPTEDEVPELPTELAVEATEEIPEISSQVEAPVEEMPPQAEIEEIPTYTTEEDMPIEQQLDALLAEPPEVEIEEPSTDVPVEELREEIPELPSEAPDTEMPPEVEMEEPPIDILTEEAPVDIPTEDLLAKPADVVLGETLPEHPIEEPLRDVPIEELTDETPAEAQIVAEIPVQQLPTEELKICPLEPYYTCICPSEEAEKGKEKLEEITPSDIPEEAAIVEPEEVKESVPSEELVEPVIGVVVESAISVLEEKYVKEEVFVEKSADDDFIAEISEIPKEEVAELSSEDVIVEVSTEVAEEEAPELLVEEATQELPAEDVVVELPTEVTEEVPQLLAEEATQEVPTEDEVVELPTELAVEVPELPAEEAIQEVPTEDEVVELPTELAVEAPELPAEEATQEVPTEDLVVEIPTELVVEEAPALPAEETIQEVPTEDIVVELPAEMAEQEAPELPTEEATQELPSEHAVIELPAEVSKEEAPELPAEVGPQELQMKIDVEEPSGEVTTVELSVEKTEEAPSTEESKDLPIKEEGEELLLEVAKPTEEAEIPTEAVVELPTVETAEDFLTVAPAEEMTSEYVPIEVPERTAEDVPREEIMVERPVEEIPPDMAVQEIPTEIPLEEIPTKPPIEAPEEAAPFIVPTAEEVAAPLEVPAKLPTTESPIKQIPGLPDEVLEEMPTEELEEKLDLEKIQEATKSAIVVVSELISRSLAHVDGGVCECCLEPHEGSPLICPLLAKKVGTSTEPKTSAPEMAAPGGAEAVVTPALVGLGEEKTDLLLQLEELLREKGELQEYINNLEELVKMKSAEMLETKNIMMQLQKKLEGEDVDLIYPPGKKIEETVSVHNTVSELQTILATLQNKCKLKDQMITALANDLRLRAQSGVFDDLIKNVSTEGPVCDFDKDQLFDFLKTTDIPPKQPTPSRQEIVVTVKPKFKAKKQAGGETDRTVAIPTSSRQSLRSIRSSTSLRDVNTMGMQVLRRVGPDSILLGWNVPPGGSFTGFEIYVNGALTHKVRSPSRNKALLQSLDLKSKVIVTMFGLTPQGRSSEPAYLTIQNPTS